MIAKKLALLMLPLMSLACGEAVVGSTPNDLGTDTGMNPGMDLGLGDAGTMALDPDAGQPPSEDLGPLDSGPQDAAQDGGPGPDAGPKADAGPPDTGAPFEERPIGGGLAIVQNGLFGGSVLALERAPSLPSRAYAGTDGAGLFRSDDSGQTWSPTALLGEVVIRISISPIDPELLYVLAHPPRATVGNNSERALLRSRDGGATFETVSLSMDTYVTDIAVSEDALWLSGSIGPTLIIQRSMDQGQTMISASIPTELNTITSILAHPDDPMIAWARDQQGVFRTGDGGSTWTNVTPPLVGNEFCFGITMSPAAPLRLWFESANGRPFVSQDGGTTWQRASAAPASSLYLFPDVDEPDVVWAAGHISGTYRTEDGGVSWQNVPMPFTPLAPSRPSLSPGSAQEALAFGRGFEIHRTTNAADWTRAVEGLTAVWTRSLAITADGGRIALGSDHGNVFISEDQGRSWSVSRAGLPPLAITALAIDPSQPQILYAGTGFGRSSGLGRTNSAGAVFKSIDGGASWSMLTPVRNGDWVFSITGLHVAPGGEVFVSEGVEVSVRSTNGGLTWQQLPSPRPQLMDIRTVPGTTTVMLTGRTRDGSPSRGRVAVSTDLGSSWQTIDDPQGVVNIDRTLLTVSSRADALVHYAITETAFAKYTGSAWGLAEVGLYIEPGQTQNFHALAAGAGGALDTVLTTGVLYGQSGTFATLHISHDGALSWSSRTLPMIGVPTTIAMAEAAPDLIVIGLESGRGALISRTGAR